MPEYECENCPIIYCFDDCHSPLAGQQTIDIEEQAESKLEELTEGKTDGLEKKGEVSKQLTQEATDVSYLNL
ncbi:hypothetical protein BCU17_05540 [Vibrio splendidus]|uniref:Uncharacterized protein n=1 Tax=Vibrio splendidus TaxID=29497 RepID=A0A2N7F7A2_VIBSP|nr:hypothetical protein [Vibrio splendidus]PMH04176.1 hypothetical protein BCU75_04635 [Vibrio splendidus]PMJ61800.1 hypothetical protein BCU17_05540 [Vibrio splendidus]